MSLLLRYLLICGLICGLTPANAQKQTADSTKPAVLVTGASSGIGRKITEHLSRLGYFVYAGARKQADLDSLNELPNVSSIRLDVTSDADIDAALKTVSAAGRGLYGLVNNAGVAVFGAATQMPESDLTLTMQVNVYGPYRITRAFAPLIKDSRGRITNIGSISGILSSRLGTSYSMSKHALESYTDSLAAEMAEFDVHVSVVEPGNYQSSIRNKVVSRARSGSLKDAEVGALEQWAKGDYKEPDEVAEAVVHALFSDKPKARYMVVPNQAEAEITIRRALVEAVQLNHDQPYAYDRAELIEMLDSALDSVE